MGDNGVNKRLFFALFAVDLVGLMSPSLGELVCMDNALLLSGESFGFAGVVPVTGSLHVVF